MKIDARCLNCSQKLPTEKIWANGINELASRQQDMMTRIYWTWCSIYTLNNCCCQVVWQKWTNQIKIFLFHINLFHSWHIFIKNMLMCIGLFFTIVCQLRNKFMLMWNKNIFIPNVRICQTTWQQQICVKNFCQKIYYIQHTQISLNISIHSFILIKGIVYSGHLIQKGLNEKRNIIFE